MGTQILIKHEDMLEAGWIRDCDVEPFINIDDEGNEFEDFNTVMYYRKGFERVSTYSPTDYCWDSNTWGGNRARQRKLDLLKLPHEFI